MAGRSLAASILFAFLLAFLLLLPCGSHVGAVTYNVDFGSNLNGQCDLLDELALCDKDDDADGANPDCP